MKKSYSLNQERDMQILQAKTVIKNNVIVSHDGTHSLQRIHWWASDVMLNFTKPVQMKKNPHQHLDGLRMSKK